MRASALWLVLTAGVLVSGCGSNDGQDGHEVIPVQEHQIAIHGTDYHPSTLAMAAGDALRFENHEQVPHTATAVASPMGELDSGDIAPNGGDHVFPHLDAGTYTFTCRHHANMRLTVSVAASQA